MGFGSLGLRILQAYRLVHGVVGVPSFLGGIISFLSFYTVSIRLLRLRV